MKFDTVIIGGGLSGLISGIYLSQHGQRCVIVSSGQSALHFSSGSFDLLNRLPDGETVNQPVTAIDKLLEQAPTHPYAKLGKEKFEVLARQAEQFFRNVDIPVYGDAEKNHYRITPMGMMRPTWLTATDFAISYEEHQLPWKKVALVNVAGFLDFYPAFLVDEFRKMGTVCEIRTFDLPKLGKRRQNPTELRSIHVARILDKMSNRNLLIASLREMSEGCDAIILPACIGLEQKDIVPFLAEKVEKPVLLLPTLPPSTVGIRIQRSLHRSFLNLGGTYMLGDNIQSGSLKEGKIREVYSQNHQDISLSGKNFILATGNYFSQGIIASKDKIYEPVFDLDVSYASDRQQWYDADLFKKQGYQEFGVATNPDFQGRYKGETIENLYVAGAILEGFNPVHQGCGGGVSLLSALHISNHILNK
ncbi:MAG: glycerol-3-phosphate dehydrogenase subunit GlpB [Tannerellaceae bacterium]|nr:glycerol-3-phosphate dehydrogenase subunit GlpB [Tannerellaceae bacterium]